MKKWYGFLIGMLAFVYMVAFCPNVKAYAAEEEDDEIIVAIDAGHSGSDSGAVGRYNGVVVTERETNLKIAQAMKKELDTYKGVKAVLTRTDNETEWDISGRVAKAVEYDADIMISLHSNADGDAMAYSGGACVIVSSGQYRFELAKLEAGLGEVILEELNRATGVRNQGLLKRLAYDTTYPNGSRADYYQLIREPIMYGIPSVVIEHCFIDNYSDYMRCLSTDAKIKKLGKADATAVAKYFGLEKKNGKASYRAMGKTVRYLNSHWMVKGGRYYYIKKDGSYATGWKKINGKLYYFKKNGQARKGFYTVKSGAKKGIYYFKKNGKAVTGWVKINGYRYYFGKNHKAFVGKKTVKRNGVKAVYYFSKRGKMLTGWRKIDGKWYYFSKRNGKLVKNKVRQ